MEDKYRLWILCGHVNEFEYWKRRFTENIPSRHRGLFECIYLSHPHKLMGNRKGKFIRVGTWYDRRTRELDEILELLHHLEFEEIRSELVDKEEEERAQWYAEAGFDRGTLYNENIKPIKVPKNVKIWGQKEITMPPAEFITEEEMTL